MGVLNLTPDSFSDGGRFLSPRHAIERARQMQREGADIIDCGGESTRPGARPVSLQEELDRVVPVIEALGKQVDALVSVDTSKPEVMLAAVAAGAGMINDVLALRADGALGVAAKLGVPVCLMHMQGSPMTMQSAPRYDDVVSEVMTFLRERVGACLAAGLPRESLVADPGFGFGKTLEHNLDLLRGLDRFAELGLPVLVGLSRKSLIGQILDKPVEDRLYGSVAAALLAAEHGAHIIRVHDVGPTVDALEVWSAFRGEAARVTA